MDSPEQNEAHKAPCTPCQGLYQAEINGGLHSLGAPKLQGQIQYLGGYWESLIGLGCVCVCLASFNQVSPQQTLGVKWSVSGDEAFQPGQKVGEAVGLRAQPSYMLNASQFSSGAQKAFALPAVKLADRVPLKSPTHGQVHPKLLYLPRLIEYFFRRETLHRYTAEDAFFMFSCVWSCYQMLSCMVRSEAKWASDTIV